jgi:c-di-GMP-binding flagellar brake protein YcgR
MAEIHFQWTGKSYPARIEDLSLTGCKLVLLRESEISLRNIFELTFTIKRLPFRVRARATGMRGSEAVGVEFVGISLSTTQYLHDLIDELEAQRRRL